MLLFLLYDNSVDQYHLFNIQQSRFEFSTSCDIIDFGIIVFPVVICILDY